MTAHDPALTDHERALAKECVILEMTDPQSGFRKAEQDRWLALLVVVCIEAAVVLAGFVVVTVVTVLTWWPK